jgi:hypothetical protein
MPRRKRHCFRQCSRQRRRRRRPRGVQRRPDCSAAILLFVQDRNLLSFGQPLGLQRGLESSPGRRKGQNFPGRARTVVLGPYNKPTDPLVALSYLTWIWIALDCTNGSLACLARCLAACLGQRNVPPRQQSSTIKSPWHGHDRGTAAWWRAVAVAGPAAPRRAPIVGCCLAAGRPAERPAALANRVAVLPRG